MAGGGGALGAERSKRGKASKRKKMKRVGFHLDMTPLVDITFLLLTFFMFTTTMAQPQIMEMAIPPEIKETVEVDENDLLSLRVRDDGAIFWNMGLDQPEEVDMKKLRALIERQHIETGKFNDVIVSLKIHDEVPYSEVVKILDELNLAEAFISEKVVGQVNDKGETIEERKRRFTIAPFLEEDMELISDGAEEVTE